MVFGYRLSGYLGLKFGGAFWIGGGIKDGPFNSSLWVLIRLNLGWGSGAGAGVPLYPAPGRVSACAGWCHPLRRSGIIVTRRLFGFEAQAKGELVRAGGLEPPRALRPNGFSHPSRLSPPLLSCCRVWGLDYPFTMSRVGLSRVGLDTLYA